MSTFAKSDVAPQVERAIWAPRLEASRSAFDMVGAHFTRYGLVIKVGLDRLPHLGWFPSRAWRNPANGLSLFDTSNIGCVWVGCKR
jgi:hypothetical protein